MASKRKGLLLVVAEDEAEKVCHEVFAWLRMNDDDRDILVIDLPDGPLPEDLVARPSKGGPDGG